MNDMSYIEKYSENHSKLCEITEKLERNLRESLRRIERIDRICGRAKSIDRFKKKSEKIENGAPKYTDPLTEIQDQIGVRIITYYVSDIEILMNHIKEYYEPIEELNKEPERFDSFGYIGKHLILFIPDEIKDWDSDANLPLFFELQIRTLFQHAWSECEHDLNYKSINELNSEDKRKIAFTSAQAWGADKIFGDLFEKYAN